jgi:hypothetical protein
VVSPVGPSPGAQAEAFEDSDDSGDSDTYGPIQPLAPAEAEALAMAQKLKDIDARASASKDSDSGTQKTLQREEWMLVPPEASRGPLEGNLYNLFIVYLTL